MVRIVFLGELDAGKSTLIGRLLYDTKSLFQEAKEEFLKISKQFGKEKEFAYLLDSFEEERKGEFTLDTTQVFMKYKNKEYLLIDVPGHKELIKNMLTGTSYADFAILVSDIEKPLAEQTKRHFYLLKFLGIKNFIIVINKMDKIGFDKLLFDKAEKEIKDFLKDIDLNPLSIIPISAKEGENVIKPSLKTNWYEGFTLIEAMDRLIMKKENKDLRFLVQDIYRKDKKEIVIGLIVSGSLRIKDVVRMSPKEENCIIKKIVVFGENKKEAKAKESIGLVLDKKGMKRGQVFYKETSPNITSEFKVKIFCLYPFKEGEKFIYKSNVQECSCSIVRINEVIDTDSLKQSFSTEIKTMEAGEVFLKTESSLVIESFHNVEELGRFILHRNGIVYAIGIIP